jgi:hypothetical protein
MPTIGPTYTKCQHQEAEYQQKPLHIQSVITRQQNISKNPYIYKMSLPGSGISAKRPTYTKCHHEAAETNTKHYIHLVSTPGSRMHISTESRKPDIFYEVSLLSHKSYSYTFQNIFIIKPRRVLCRHSKAVAEVCLWNEWQWLRDNL